MDPLPIPSSKPGLRRLGLAAISLALGALAQLLIDDWSLRWSIALYVAAAGLLWRSVSGIELFRGPASPRLRTSEAADAERILGSVGFALGAILLALALRRFEGGPSFAAAWYLYGAAMVLILVALPTIEGRWTALTRRWKAGAVRPSFDRRAWLIWGGLVAILVLALLLRTYRIDELPAGLWYDEADNLRHAQRFQQDPGSVPVFVPSTNLPSMFLIPMAATVKLAGVSPATGRLVAAGFGLSGIVAIFLLARLLMGPLLGLVAALLTAGMRWDINWGRIGMHGITLPLFASLTAYLTLRATRSGRVSDFGFAGGALGLGMWFYTSFRLFPLVVAFLLAHHLVVDRPGLGRFAMRVAVMVAISLAVAAPLVGYAAREPDAFFARTRTTSVFASRPLGEALGEMRTSLVKHALMFNLRGDPNPRHNLPGRPMLDPVMAVLFVLGLGVAAVRWRVAALASLPLWIFVMILPGVITLPWEAPQSLRGIGAAPAVVLSVTAALGALWSLGGSASWPALRWATPVLLAAVLGVVAFLNVNTYFGAQASHPEVYAGFSTDETIMARDMAEQQRRGYSLLTSRQFLYSLNTLLLAHDPRYNVVRPSDLLPIDSAGIGAGVAIYLEPREASVYRLLRVYYPDGVFREVRPPGGGRLMLFIVVLTRDQILSRQGLRAVYSTPDGVAVEKVLRSTAVAWAVDGRPGGAFDLLWEGALHVRAPGARFFALEGGDTVEVLLDGRRILGGEQTTVAIEPAVGLHSLRVQGRIGDGSELLRLLWGTAPHALEPIPQSNLFHGTVRPVGLAGRFFDGGSETENPDVTHVTHALDRFYYDPPLSEPFLAVWDGALDVRASGQHRFRISGFGTVRLFLDGDLLASTDPESRPAAEGRRYLESGEHSIRVEFASPSSPSQLELLWAGPGRELAPIPIGRLAPSSEHMLRIVPADE